MTTAESPGEKSAYGESGWRLLLAAAAPWMAPDVSGLRSASHGALWVAVHGLIHDPGGLASQFGVSAGSGDAARIIAEAFEQHGERVLKALRGVFVVAIADAASERVLVARDPLGSHPLFYARAGGRIAFAESITDLRSLPDVSTALNRAALADHLCHRWPDPFETFFEGVHRVPPGHVAVVSANAISSSRYWDPADTATAASGDEFAALFAQAVDRCLGFGPAGIFLSGGLDSISVAACAADRAAVRHAPQPLALSLGMPDPECDERDTQRAVAQVLGLPLRLVSFDEAVGERGLIREAVRIGATLSSPLLNIWAPAYLSLASMASSQGVRTILSGTGGDEWLSVSPYVSADLIARGDAAGWWRFFNSFRKSYQHSVLKHIFLTGWTFGLRPVGSRTASRLLGGPWRRRRASRAVTRDPLWVAPDPALRQRLNERSARSLDEVDPKGGFYIREMRTGLEHALTSWELEEQYEFGNRTGQRFMHPYWDADLVDMLYRTPPHLLMEGGRAKGLVRAHLASRFPAVGLDRQRKVSGTSFYRSLVIRHLPGAAADVGACRVLEDLGIITGRAARDYATEEFGSPTNRWDVINLETWARANLGSNWET